MKTDTVNTDTDDGYELITRIGEEPTLDFFYDRNPKFLSDEQLMSLIGIERKSRALFIEKKGK